MQQKIVKAKASVVAFRVDMEKAVRARTRTVKKRRAIRIQKMKNGWRT